jgi:hypothetical protein
MTEEQEHAQADVEQVTRISGGYQVVATWLTRTFGERVSRQRVYSWWAHRAGNGFPEGFERPTAKGSVRRFHVDDVIEWRRGALGEPAAPTANTDDTGSPARDVAEPDLEQPPMPGDVIGDQSA